MPPFVNPHEPVALVDEAIKFEPSNDVHRVQSLEQMGQIGPIDYGSASAGGDATESGSNIIDLEDELEMDDSQLGQFVVNPISLVEIEIKQTGEQDQRFVNKNKLGVITPHLPAQQRLIWVLESSGINAIITNPQTYDMQKTLVYYTGYKYTLDPDPLSESELKRMPGKPAAVPIDSLKKQPREATTL